MLDGDESGWRQLMTALSYEYASIRIQVCKEAAPGFEPCRLPLGLQRPSLALVTALAFEVDGIADWLGRRMVKSLHDQVFGDWTRQPFPFFALCLWARLRDREIPSGNVAPLTEAYDGLLRLDGDLTAAITAACDYHLAETRSTASYSGSFTPGPHNIWPVELQAWQRLAREAGVEVPHVEHPLLETPLARLPSLDTIRLVDADPLLDEVEQAAHDAGEW